jgi:hypothetical protein
MLTYFQVERIRHVGTILLEMMQNVDNELIRARANPKAV